MHAVNVENPLLKTPASLNTAEFIVEKGLTNAANVGNLLAKALVSFNTRRYILDNGLMSDVMNQMFMCPTIRFLKSYPLM